MGLILVEKKSGKRIDLSKVLKNGKYTELAVPGEEYYLIDRATGKTPEDIKVTRSGNDLILKSEKENVEVIIDDFWGKCDDEQQCFAIFDVGASEGVDAGQVIVTQVGKEFSSFSEIEAGMTGTLAEGDSFRPWLYGLAGLTVLGLGAAAAGGSGGGGSSAHSAPSDTTPPSQPTDVVIKNDGKQITGKAEPGSKITIKDDQGNVIANGKADEQGNFSIDLNPPKNNGEKVEVTATDNAGNTSTPTDVIASDSTPPAKPKNLDVSDDGTRVTGTAEPGSTVTVKDENGKEIGTATAGDDGKFDVTINPPKTNGEELTVEAKDEAGNPSQPNTVKADDSTPPAKPENLGVSDDGTRVTGTAEPGSTVTVKDEKDNVIGTGKANEEDGKFDITLDEPKTALEELSVTATDNANNESNSEKVTAPLVVPKTKPDFDYAVPVAGVDKLYNAKEVGTDGTITVKVIPNANIGDSVSITRDGKTEVFKITTDNKNGIEVEVKPGSEISAFIIGANGVAGEIASQTLQNADVDVPNVKPIITFESTGTDNIYNIEEVKRGKPNTITATVKFPDAREGDIVVVNGQKTRITTENLISGVEVEVEPNTEVKAYIKDDAGNQGFISTSIAPKADLEKPDAPIKVDVASDNSPADNVLTRNEINKHGEVPVRVYLPQGLEEGDKLIVTPSTKKGSPIEHPLTKAEIDQGYAIVDAPTGVDALGQGKVSFTAQLIDKAGNSSTEKDSDNYDVKRALLGKPSVEYPDDKDNNQVLLGEELAGNTTSVKINLPNIGEGDTVSITINGEEYGVDVITQKVTHNDKTFEFKPATDDDGYTVTINDISIADGSVSEVVTNVVVTANNTELKADGTVRIDRSQPGGRDNNGDAKGDDKPTLEIPEAVNPSLEKDGNINAQELSDGVVAKVTLPEGVQAGDVIVIKNNGQELYTYTIPQGTTTTKGSVIEFSIPKEKLPSGAYELSASVKEPDSYGDKARESEDSNTIAFKVDNKIPGDSNGDGVVNGSDENSGQPIVTVTDAHTTEGQDKPVGNKDLENGIQVEVTIPKGTEAGDTVEVTVKTPNGEVKKTAKVEEGDLPENGDGKVTVTVPTKDLQDNNGKVPDGDYSVTAVVTDPAGNSSATSDETKFTVDTTAPGDSNGDGKVDRDDKNGGKPVVAVPEATDADGNTINAGDLKDGVQVEVTLPGGVAAGDVVTLEVKTPNSNDPIKVTKTLESGDITAGKVTVDIPKADLPKDSDGKVDGAYQVTATVSDKAGNTSLVSDAKGFTIDATVPGDTNGDGKADTNDINGKPSVSIPEDTDGGVTATEFNDGVQVKVTLPAGTQEGDTITLTVTPKGGEAFTVISAISDSDLSTETATVTIPKDQFPETPKGDYTVSAQIKDAAGNQSLPSVKKTFTVLDTVVPGDTNGDGEADADGKPNVLVVDAHTSDNQDKPVGSDDLKDGVQVEVTLPKGTEVGDTVTVTMTKPDGSTVTATGTVAKGDLPGTGDGKVTVTVPNKQFPTDEKGKITEGEYKVTATVKDADGNTSLPSDEAKFTVDTTAPGDSNGDGFANSQGDDNDGKPVITIPEAKDGVNASELGNGVQVKVTLPAGTQEGDQVYLTLTPEGKAPIAIEPPYQVQAEDLNGERTVDITIPKDTLPKDAESGKTLDGNFTVTAQVKDAAGNTSQPSDKASFTVDTVEISGKPGVTIPEMDNNSVNASEFATAQGVDIKVTLPEGTQAGDTLTVTVSADGKAPITITKKLTAEDLSTTDGLTIHIPASKESNQANSFPVKADGSYTVVAKVSDGTTTVESEPASLVIDATVPGDSNGDGVVNEQDANGGKPVVAIPEATDADGNTINADDLKDGVQVNVTLPKGTQVGDTVTLTVKPENGEAFTVPYTVKEGDDVSGNGTPVSVTIPKQHEDKDLNGAYTVTAVVTDAAGNSSATSDKAKFTVDATVPGDTTSNGVADDNGKPVVTIPENADGGVKATEFNENGVQVNVTLPKGTQVGDTVTLTVKPASGNEFTVTYSVKDTDNVTGSGSVTVDIPTTKFPSNPDGAYTVTAKVTDPAGNSSKVSAPADFKVDTTVPGDTTGDGVADDDGKPVIESIPEATEADGYSINATEFSDGIEVQVRLPQGTQVGDTVTLTLQPQTGDAITVDYKVQSGDLSGTDPIVTIPVEKEKFPAQADGEYTVTAQVKDPAGNNSLVSEGKTFTVDTQAPNVTAPEAKKDGSVVITLPNDADKVTVTVQPEGETKPRDITLTKGDDGSWTSSDPAVVPNVPNGSTTTTIPNDKVTDGSEVTVSAQDKAGNSHSVSVNAVDVNDAPVLTIKPEDIVKTGFTKGQATAGKLIATVTATDPDKDDTVTIQLLNNDDGYFVLDSGTGEISLTEKGATFVNAGNNLPSIQVKAIDNKYLGSEAKTVNIADTIDTSNTLEITSNDGESVTGTTDPLSTVEIRNANNEVVGRGAAGSDGQFTIKLTHEEVVSLGTEKANQDIQADHNGDGEPETYHTDEEGNYRYSVDSPIKTGETLTVTSTNSYDNRATEQSETPDKIAPSAPVIEINEQGTVISGIAEPGSTIVLQVTKDGQPMQQVAKDKNDQSIIANEEGKFTIELKDPLIGKETITATAEDKAHNISPSSDSITAPYFNNKLEDVGIVLRNDTGISDRDNITNDGGLKLVSDDSAMITKVEYKDAEGNYQTLPAVGGVYTLPEGVYEAGAIRVTQQDDSGAIKRNSNSQAITIDTTAPDAATAVNDKDEDGKIIGTVTITLPNNAEKGDYVEVMVGNKKVTLTSDGNNGWTSDNESLVPTPVDNQVTIPTTAAPSGTGVSVQSFDIAGNKADKDSDNTLIDRNKITVALEHPEVNNNLMNDTNTMMVLNTAELEASGSPSNVTVKIYLPDSAKVGDFVEFPFGSSTLQSAVKQTDIDNGYFEVKAGFPMNFALSQGENKYPVKLYQSDKTTVKSESEPLLIYVDKLTPDTPVVTSETGGEVTITLPTGKRSNFDPSTSIGTQAEVGDWVIITAGDQSVKLTKTANGWEKPTEVDWIKIDGNTATIPTNIKKFPYGTTVTAQAFDKAGNQSEQGVGHVVKDPLKFTDFKVNNQDLDTSTPNIVDTNQKAIYYTATVEGQEAEEAIIRVRLMKGDQQVEVHYLDISSDSQTYKGAFNNLSADYEQYQVIADIVHQDKNTRFNDANLPERSVDVIVDNVVPQLDFSKITSSVLDGPNNKPNSVTIVATDGSHTLKDGNNTVSGAAEMTMKLDFGNAQSDKQRIITDKLGNKVVVYNPKLDWMMRKDDDDDTSIDQYHNDHAQGWGFDTKTAVMYNQDKALFYKWNGDNEAADIIVSGMSRTDEWWNYYNRRGWIGAENTGSSTSLTNKTMTQFIMDTLGGGNDYISAPAIAGNVVIRTNDGDDMITTMNLQGRYDYYIGLGYSRPNVDGSNQIYMGDGNDTFEVTGTAKDTEDPNKAGAVRDEMKYASLYATNAKIDMGAGNDKVSIKWNVFAGSQQESGNYFNLGEGDDTMTVGGNVLGQLRENSYEGSTIINLGSGNDTLSLAKIERESIYLPPLVLITSKESANVTIGNVKEAQLSMMMGDGEDKVTISKDLILSGQKSDWISQVFANNDRFVQQGIERYKDFYDQALKDQINSSLERAIDLIATDSQDRSATGGSRAVIGANRVATSTSEGITEIIDVLDLGDGQNTLSVTGKMFGVNYFGGKDVDTIRSGVTENSRFWLGLGEDSVELAQMANSAIYAGAGEDKITVGGIAKQEGRGSIISAEDGNDTIIINKLPNKSVALEADNSRIFGGNGDDTITINGDLFGTGNQIFGDAGNDTITISGNIRGSNNLIDGGAGNDTITLKGEVLKDLGGKFEIRGGDGNDTISVGNISTEDNVSIFAGNGNDIVTIKNVKGDNDHIIDLGEDVNKTDYDILSIEGSQSEGYNNQFSIGGTPSDHTQIWGAEEIRFAGTGVTVKIVSGNLVNNNTGPSPAGKDELFIRNDGGDAANKVVLSGSGWTKSKTAVEHSFNGVSYQNVDVYKHSSSDDILYIQQGVTVII
ncbi:Ig-like domain-containing protein [Gallibacterium anatis]|uniref:Ig-like domain-containing protein n=1 Tax=Gallibacterium anatis TaxID=750 RepID=UPI0030057294